MVEGEKKGEMKIRQWAYEVSGLVAIAVPGPQGQKGVQECEKLQECTLLPFSLGWMRLSPEVESLALTPLPPPTASVLLSETELKNSLAWGEKARGVEEKVELPGAGGQQRDKSYVGGPEQPTRPWARPRLQQPSTSKLA